MLQRERGGCTMLYPQRGDKVPRLMLCVFVKTALSRILF